MNSKSAGIYLIISKTNGKRYVGSAVRICDRWSQHKTDLRANKHHSQHLQRHYNKYGEQDLVFSILEVIERGDLGLQEFKELLLSREQVYLDNWDECQFNYLKTAGSTLGLKHQDSKYYSYLGNRYITYYYVNAKLLHFKRCLTKEDAIKEVEYIKTLTEEELIGYEKQCRAKSIRVSRQGKCYSWNKSRNKWTVSISINGKSKCYGQFKTEQEAIDRVKQVKLELGI